MHTEGATWIIMAKCLQRQNQVNCPEMICASVICVVVVVITFSKLVLISDVATRHVSSGFGHNHAAYVSPVHFDRLHGPIFHPGVKHHIAVDLLCERGREIERERESEPLQSTENHRCSVKLVNKNKLKIHLSEHKGSIEGEAYLPVFDGLDRCRATSVHALMDNRGDQLFMCHHCVFSKQCSLLCIDLIQHL